MLAGWFARDSRPAIRERKFLNGTYVPTYAHVRADEYPSTYVPGIQGPDALGILIDAVRKKVSSLMEHAADEEKKGRGNNTFIGHG